MSRSSRISTSRLLLFPPQTNSKTLFRLRYIHRFLLGILILSISSLTYAEPDISVGNVSGAPGDNVSIPVNFTNNGSVVSLQFDLQYDASQLTFNSAAAGTGLGAHGFATSNPALGTVRIVITPTPDNAMMGSGEITSIPVSINAATITNQTITINNVVMSNASSQSVMPTALYNGVVTVLVSDIQPPSIPAGVSANAISTSQIDLNWGASTDSGGGTVAGYKVYRDGNPTAIATVIGTSYSDNGLTFNTLYSYTIVAFDTASPANESLPSIMASATTLTATDTFPPSVPTTISATAASQTQINLTWAPSMDVGGGTVAGYKIYRDGNPIEIATVTGTSYNDSGLTANTSYSYTVTAFDTASPVNESLPSSAVTATTQSQPINTNLLTNSGFETGDKTGWRSSGSIESGNAYSGSYALALAGNPIKFLSAKQTVSVNGGSTYRFELWMSITGRTTGKYLAQIRWYNASGSEITGTRVNFGSSNANTSYTRKSTEATAPVDAVKLQLHLKANKADGTGYFDDISITDLSAPTVPDAEAPSIPTGVTATAVSDTQINLSWTASTDTGGGTVAGYKIFRDGNLTEIASVTGTSYSDTGLTANTAYNYTVTAFDTASPANESSPSSGVGDTTLTAPVVTNLLVNPGFETGDKTGWRSAGSVLTGDVHTGSFALAVPGNPVKFLASKQTISVTGGSTYRLEFWLSVTGRTTGKYLAQIRWYNASGSEISGTRVNFGSTNANTGYIRKSTDATAPVDAVSLRFHLKANKADGIGYFDDISIYQLP